MSTIFGILTFMSMTNSMLNLVEHEKKFYNLGTWPRGYKTFFMLNSAEHKIYPAHKC